MIHINVETLCYFYSYSINTVINVTLSTFFISMCSYLCSKKGETRTIYHILADVTALAPNIVLLLQIAFSQLSMKKNGEDEEIAQTRKLRQDILVCANQKEKRLHIFSSFPLTVNKNQ